MARRGTPPLALGYGRKAGYISNIFFWDILTTIGCLLFSFPSYSSFSLLGEFVLMNVEAHAAGCRMAWVLTMERESTGGAQHPRKPKFRASRKTTFVHFMRTIPSPGLNRVSRPPSLFRRQPESKRTPSQMSCTHAQTVSTTCEFTSQSSLSRIYI